MSATWRCIFGNGQRFKRRKTGLHLGDTRREVAREAVRQAELVPRRRGQCGIVALRRDARRLPEMGLALP